jgi:prepilin-type N-terminal cleavage/methylation domain-containing protein
MRRRGEGGFTLIEIMVSLVLLVVGLLGIMALQATTVRANRLSRELERARVYAMSMMEDLRGKDLMALSSPTTLDDIVTEDGVTYSRVYTIGSVSGSTNLRLITVTVTYAENGNSADTHSASMQMVRTTLEKL